MKGSQKKVTRSSSSKRKKRSSISRSNSKGMKRIGSKKSFKASGYNYDDYEVSESKGKLFKLYLQKNWLILIKLLQD